MCIKILDREVNVLANIVVRPWTDAKANGKDYRAYVLEQIYRLISTSPQCEEDVNLVSHQRTYLIVGHRTFGPSSWITQLQPVGLLYVWNIFECDVNIRYVALDDVNALTILSLKQSMGALQKVPNFSNPKSKVTLTL